MVTSAYDRSSSFAFENVSCPHHDGHRDIVLLVVCSYMAGTHMGRFVLPCDHHFGLDWRYEVEDASHAKP